MSFYRHYFNMPRNSSMNTFIDTRLIECNRRSFHLVSESVCYTLTPWLHAVQSGMPLWLGQNTFATRCNMEIMYKISININIWSQLSGRYSTVYSMQWIALQYLDILGRKIRWNGQNHKWVWIKRHIIHFELNRIEFQSDNRWLSTFHVLWIIICHCVLCVCKKDGIKNDFVKEYSVLRNHNSWQISEITKVNFNNKIHILSAIQNVFTSDWHICVYMSVPHRTNADCIRPKPCIRIWVCVEHEMS